MIFSVGSWRETSTVTIKSRDTISSPDYGIHYITSDGTKGYAPLNSTVFTISVAKNSFINLFSAFNSVNRSASSLFILLIATFNLSSLTTK